MNIDEIKGKRIENFVAAVFFSCLIGILSAFFLVRDMYVVFGIFKDHRIIHGNVVNIVYGVNDSTETFIIKYKVLSRDYLMEADLVWENNRERLRVGDGIDVIYLNGNPKQAKVNIFSELFLPIIISGSFFTVSLFLIWLSFKKREWLITREGGMWLD